MSIGLFEALRHFREPPDLAAKTAAGCRGASLKVRDDSIEAREHTHFEPKIKGLFSPSRFAPSGAPPRAGGGYLVADPLGVNRSFSGDPQLISEAFGSSSRAPPRRLGKRASLTSSARLSTSRNVVASPGFSRACAPSDPFVAAPFRAEAAIYSGAGPTSTA